MYGGLQSYQDRELTLLQNEVAAHRTARVPGGESGSPLRRIAEVCATAHRAGPGI